MGLPPFDVPTPLAAAAGAPEQCHCCQQGQARATTAISASAATAIRREVLSAACWIAGGITRTAGRSIVPQTSSQRLPRVVRGPAEQVGQLGDRARSLPRLAADALRDGFRQDRRRRRRETPHVDDGRRHGRRGASPGCRRRPTAAGRKANATTRSRKHTRRRHVRRRAGRDPLRGQVVVSFGLQIGVRVAFLRPEDGPQPRMQQGHAAAAAEQNALRRHVAVAKAGFLQREPVRRQSPGRFPALHPGESGHGGPATGGRAALGPPRGGPEAAAVAAGAEDRRQMVRRSSGRPPRPAPTAAAAVGRPSCRPPRPRPNGPFRPASTGPGPIAGQPRAIGQRLAKQIGSHAATVGPRPALSWAA